MIYIIEWQIADGSHDGMVRDNRDDSPGFLSLWVICNNDTILVAEWMIDEGMVLDP